MAAFDTWDTLVLPHFHNAFLVSFEPLLDKWATLLARNTRSRHAGQLGHHHPRGVALPFAVSDHEGFSDFHVSPRDGCSSLKRQHKPERGDWKSRSFIMRECAKTVQVRRVPCITLRTVLQSWLGGRPVARIKIDAQGVDLAVMQSAGEENLLSVGEVVMEVLHDSCDGLYSGQPNCTTVTSEMLGMGFATRKQCSDKGNFYTVCAAHAPPAQHQTSHATPLHRIGCTDWMRGELPLPEHTVECQRTSTSGKGQA